MENAEYQNIFQNEGTNFYYVATHALVLALVRRYVPMKRRGKILDAGAGTGMLAKKLRSMGVVTAIDVHEQAIFFARARGVTVRKASLGRLPYRANTFDVTTCIDVLYHRQVEDDVQALRELYRVLRPGGVLIVRVAALPWARTAHDDVVHARHRYQKKELDEKLTGAGFTVDKLSYVGLVLLPFRLARKLYETVVHPKRPTSAVTPLPVLINWVLTTIMLLEHWLVVYINLPIGIGLIAVARK